MRLSSKHLLLVVLCGVSIAGVGEDFKCDRICYGNLPCQVTEVDGRLQIKDKLCAGDLVLKNGALLVIESDRALISAERTLKVEGAARLVSISSISTPEHMGSPASSANGKSHDPGPETDGPGNAENGANGEDGIAGVDGQDGSDGRSGATVTLSLGRFEGGKLYVGLNGENGQDGQDGGDGGEGGNGQQGGRAIPGQPFGCKSGPGRGGRGGTGGNAGTGGAGGDGGDGGVLAIRIPEDLLKEVESLVQEKIIIEVAAGRAAKGGANGKPGHGGAFGWGGRGSQGCEGRIEERKGNPGGSGAPAQSPRRDGSPGNAGEIKILGIQ